METIKIQCKVISPMFIGNADVEKAELRPSAFENSLRFWWRAVHPNLSVYELRKQETEFFGGSYQDDNNTVNKAPSYRFLEITGGKITNNEIDLDPRDDKNRGKAKAIMTNSSVFTIKLQILNNKEKVLALFKLASALGGLGKRSRRGAGAWKIIKIEEKENKKDNNIKYDKEDIDKWINTINPNYQNNTNTSNYPYLKEYTIGDKTYQGQRELRIRIMETAHKCKYHNDYKDCLGEATRNERLSSPVYVSMIEDNDGIKPIISVLKSECSNTKLQDNFIKCILNNNKCNNNCQ